MTTLSTLLFSRAKMPLSHNTNAVRAFAFLRLD